MEGVAGNLAIAVIMVYLASYKVEYLKRKTKKGRLSGKGRSFLRAMILP